VPDTFDLNLWVTVNGVGTEPARFLATSLGLWLERILAGLVRNYMLMGYEAVVKEMKAAGRTAGAIKQFTKAQFDSVVQAGYVAHEERTSKVLSPGTFLRESRFDAVSRFFASASCGGRWAAESDEVLVGRLLVICMVAVNNKPEVVHHMLQKHVELFENFPDSHAELTITLRDLWADAPRNKSIAEQRLQSSFGSTREAVEVFISSLKKRSSTCACPHSANCRLGRRRPPFVKTTICRAQPWALHRETSQQASKSGLAVDDQWSESCASAAAMLADTSTMASLLKAATHGGELAVVDCIKYRKLRAKGGVKARSSGIKHAKTVRPVMMARVFTGAWARMSMQRQGVQESVLPGDNALAPSLAAMPMRRVEAFMENCE
jgi:hypothetical protein